MLHYTMLHPLVGFSLAAPKQYVGKQRGTTAIVHFHVGGNEHTGNWATDANQNGAQAFMRDFFVTK